MGVTLCVLKRMRIFCWLLSMCMCLGINAQNFAPIAVGKYAGVHAAKINPSLTAYTPYQWHVNIIGVWGNVNNNYVNLKLPYSAYRLAFNKVPVQYQTINGNPRFDSSFLVEDFNRKRKFAGVGAIAYLPSFTMKFKKIQIGLLNDVVVLANVSGLDEPLAHALMTDLSNNRKAFKYFILDKNGNYNLNRTTVSANAYVSSGINIAYNMPMMWKQQMMFGATVKKIWGLGGSYFQYDNMQVHRGNPFQLQFDKTNIRYALYQGQGKGMGVDLGWSYAFHLADYKRNGDYLKRHKMYKYKFGLSIMDVGSVRYRDASVTAIENATTTTWDASNFKNNLTASQPDVSLAPLNNVFKGVSGYTTGKQDVIIGLPTRFVASIDYQYSKYVFIQTQVMQSLRGRYAQAARYQSYAMIAPRYEREKWEVSMPVLLEYDYRSLRAGLSFRAGCFYIGSNSVFNFLYTRNMRDADIYMGFTVYRFSGTKNSRFIQMMRDQIDRLDKKKPDCEKM